MSRTLRIALASTAVAALVATLGAGVPADAQRGSTAVTTAHAAAVHGAHAKSGKAAVGKKHHKRAVGTCAKRKTRKARAACRARLAAPRSPISTPMPVGDGTNPLAGRAWGVYQGSQDQAWPPYEQATGETKQLLGRIALAPRSKWYGAWIKPEDIEAKVRSYIASAAGGDTETLVQMAVFNMQPWEHEACSRLPTAAEQASYRQWIDAFARGVGAQHAAVILQPDGPFALCAPGGSTLPSTLIAYASQKLSSLPATSVYIDGGAADWPYQASDKAVDFLVRDGIQYARGVALNSTHYSATGDEIERGAEIVTELARRGIRGKHVVINTSSNGRPFTFGTAPGSDPDNATVCASRASTHCVTLGIRPTTDVGNPAWGLTSTQRAQALACVDAYMWFGRPWLYRQADPFDLQRALQLVRTTPY